MKGGVYVFAHIIYPNRTWGSGHFCRHQLEGVYGTDNIVSGLHHGRGAARVYFARDCWFTHFIVSAVRGLFAVVYSRGKPAQCPRTASAAGTRGPGRSFAVQSTAVISGEGAGRSRGKNRGIENRRVGETGSAWTRAALGGRAVRKYACRLYRGD